MKKMIAPPFAVVTAWGAASDIRRFLLDCKPCMRRPAENVPPSQWAARPTETVKQFAVRAEFDHKAMSHHHPKVTICVLIGSRLNALLAGEPVAYNPPRTIAPPTGGAVASAPRPVAGMEEDERLRLFFAPQVSTTIPEREFTIEVEWVAQSIVTVEASNLEEAIIQAEAAEMSRPRGHGTAVRTVRVGDVPVNLIHNDESET